MSEEESLEVVEFTCQEEKRTARLMVRVRQEGESKKVVGIECDNPKFHSIENWECSWPCWRAVQAELDKQGSE